MRQRVIRIILTIGICGLVWGGLGSGVDAYTPKDFSIKVVTADVPGGKAYITATLKAPPQEIWHDLLDANTMAGKYPRMKRAFCVERKHVMETKKDRLRNGATVNRRYKKEMCDPYTLRDNGKNWTFYLFQEIDYPFPLSDRWVMSEVLNDESDAKKGIFRQVGILMYGRQDVYEFKIDISPHPENPKETIFKMYIHSDPGGFIADWMIRTATEYIAPKYMEILEGQTRKRLGMSDLRETEGRWQ